jgi:hypothetical protein
MSSIKVFVLIIIMTYAKVSKLVYRGVNCFLDLDRKAKSIFLNYDKGH